MENDKKIDEVAGYDIVELRRGQHKMIRVNGEYFRVPERMFDISEELSDHLGGSWGEASYAYGDEGQGYEANLMLMYLLSDKGSRDEIRKIIDELDQ